MHAMMREIGAGSRRGIVAFAMVASVFVGASGAEAKEVTEIPPSRAGCATSSSNRSIELEDNEDVDGNGAEVLESSIDLTEELIATAGSGSEPNTFPVWDVEASHKDVQHFSAGEESVRSQISVRSTRGGTFVEPQFVTVRTVQQFTLDAEPAPPGEPLASIELDYTAAGFPKVFVTRNGVEVHDVFLSSTVRGEIH